MLVSSRFGGGAEAGTEGTGAVLKSSKSSSSVEGIPPRNDATVEPVEVTIPGRGEEAETDAGTEDG